MERQETQSYLAFVEEATKALQNDTISYTEWCKAIVGEKIYSDETLRRCAVLFGEFLERLDADEIKTLNDEDRVNRLIEAKEELVKERKKIQSANLEHQEYYRKVARHELLDEMIVDAIKRLEPVKIKHEHFTKPSKSTGVLVLADEHFDSTFVLKGLNGEIINAYDKEIFKERMWRLLSMIESDNFGYDELLIVSCGDAIENVLRMGSLQKLRSNVVDAVIEFSEFMSQWLIAVQEKLKVPVKFAIISGNHGVNRILTQPAVFPEETFAKIIHKFIEMRLEGCKPDITVEPYGDVYFTCLYGNNLLFAHGETNNLIELANYYENFYDIQIDCLYAGHLHRSETQPAGIGYMGDREMIRVPSTVGTDPYAKSIQKHSRAGVYFAVYNENGRDLSKIYYLN